MATLFAQRSALCGCWLDELIPEKIERRGWMMNSVDLTLKNLFSEGLHTYANVAERGLRGQTKKLSVDLSNSIVI